MWREHFILYSHYVCYREKSIPCIQKRLWEWGSISGLVTAAHHNIDSLIFLFHTRLKVARYPFLHSLGGESNCPHSVAKYRPRPKMSSICPNILGNYLPLRGNTWLMRRLKKRDFFFYPQLKELSKSNMWCHFSQLNRQTRNTSHFPLRCLEDIIPFGHLVYWLLQHVSYHWNKMAFQSSLLDLKMCP